ncbi:MAG: hypothetical protein HYX92_20795 [Chloroflexi bacterium]|nr:hypothetical protein [Chloroflexota bacterium]
MTTHTEDIVEVVDNINAIYEYLDGERLLDGLPAIPPTPDAVKAFLEAVGREAEEVIGYLEPLGGQVTYEKVAANAVMAGCRPEYMPVIVAAVEILCDTRDPLPEKVAATQTTSHSRHVFLVVNGPVRTALGITSGESGTSVSWRANATIGRAIQLILLNLGGFPGVTEWKTWGFYVSRCYCMGENEEQSPWEPFHVEHGFSPSDSTVTLLTVEPPHHMELTWASTSEELLLAFARTMSAPACRDSYGDCYPNLVLGPDQAKGLAESGFSKTDVKRFLFEHARTPYHEFGTNAASHWKPYWRKFFAHDPSALVPMVARPEDFNVFVIGGPGPQSLHLPNHKTPVELCMRQIRVPRPS